MLTARGFSADVLRGREVGAAGYITKPFSPEELIDRVRAILE
jgi:DNA-binding response OmpR family regulator